MRILKFIGALGWGWFLAFLLLFAGFQYVLHTNLPEFVKPMSCVKKATQSEGEQSWAAWAQGKLDELKDSAKSTLTVDSLGTLHGIMWPGSFAVYLWTGQGEMFTPCASPSYKAAYEQARHDYLGIQLILLAWAIVPWRKMLRGGR